MELAVDNKTGIFYFLCEHDDLFSS